MITDKARVVFCAISWHATITGALELAQESGGDAEGAEVPAALGCPLSTLAAQRLLTVVV